MANPTSPHLFDECSEKDESIIINELKNNEYALFLRKVNYKFPDDKLIQLSSWDIENEKKISKNNNYIFRPLTKYLYIFNNCDITIVISIGKKIIKFVFYILLLEFVVNFYYFIIMNVMYFIESFN